MTNKICPLYKAAGLNGGFADARRGINDVLHVCIDEDIIACDGKDCGTWDKELERCGLISRTVVVVNNIADEL